MLKLLKKLAGQSEPPPAVQAPRKKSSSQGRRDYALSEPAPLPEVKEGNEPSDWDLWQDSVDSLQDATDSQLAPFAGSVREFAPTAPARLEEELDPFSRVSKNRDS